MDWNSLKGKTLDDALLAEVQAEVAELTSRAETAEGKARAAQKESIEGRKSLKEFQALAMEKLGIDSPEQLAGLPDAKGQAEAKVQFDVQLKRLTRERDEVRAQFDALSGQVMQSKRDAAIAQAVASQKFLDADVARDLISVRLKQEGDDFVFSADGGRQMSVKDGAAWLAASKPLLVQPAANGATGSGFKPHPINGMQSFQAANQGETRIDTAAIYAARQPQAARAAA